MSQRHIEILLGHNLWATRLLLQSSATLDEEQFYHRFDIGPGSLHDTLRHIIGAMLRWADRIGGRAVAESIERPGEYCTIAELDAHLTRADAALREVAAELDAANRWDEKMQFATPDGAVYHFTRAAGMLHVLTHGMHHRAQVLNIRRRLGLPPFTLDLDVVEWECVQTGQIDSDERRVG
ncbi:MAG: DinB family protein [Phycisphaerae bacterium]